MAKFKKGDAIHKKSSDKYKIIRKVEDENYVFNVFNKGDGVLVRFNFLYDISYIDSCNELYTFKSSGKTFSCGNVTWSTTKFRVGDILTNINDQHKELEIVDIHENGIDSYNYEVRWSHFSGFTYCYNSEDIDKLYELKQRCGISAASSEEKSLDEPVKEIEKICTCSSRDLFNKGCTCNSIERFDERKLWK